MRYLTKEWYKKDMIKNSFQMEIEIIDRNDKNLEEIFLVQYKKEFNKMKKNNKLPQNYEDYFFENIFNGCLENTKIFFDKETLKKVRDIRLLALGKVFKEEYDFIEKEVIAKDAYQAYLKEFKEIENKIPSNIKDNLDLHDCKIVNIIKEPEKLIIELDSSGGFVDVKSVIFEDYEIIEEETNFINGWWLYEEIYITDSLYETHSLISVPQKNNQSKLGYFTIRAKNIIFQ